MVRHIRLIFILVVIVPILGYIFIGDYYYRHFDPVRRKYVAKIDSLRELKDYEMEHDPSSPFNAKGKIRFEKLKYFEADPVHIAESKIFEYPNKQTLTIYGANGEPMQVIRYGHVNFKMHGKYLKMNVYKCFGPSGEEYYSILFTDRTANNETYGAGRYLDFEKVDNPDYIYKIDFNKAYNPYSAYSPNYRHADPAQYDYVDVEIEAGEKKFHN